MALDSQPDHEVMTEVHDRESWRTVQEELWSFIDSLAKSKFGDYEDEIREDAVKETFQKVQGQLVNSDGTVDLQRIDNLQAYARVVFRRVCYELFKSRSAELTLLADRLEYVLKQPQVDVCNWKGDVRTPRVVGLKGWNRESVRPARPDLLENKEKTTTLESIISSASSLHTWLLFVLKEHAHPLTFTDLLKCLLQCVSLKESKQDQTVGLYPPGKFALEDRDIIRTLFEKMFSDYLNLNQRRALLLRRSHGENELCGLLHSLISGRIFKRAELADKMDIPVDELNAIYSGIGNDEQDVVSGSGLMDARQFSARFGVKDADKIKESATAIWKKNRQSVWSDLNR